MDEVLNDIATKLSEEKQEQQFLVGLNMEYEEGVDLITKIRHIPWQVLKSQLENLNRQDIVEHIKQNSVITKGIGPSQNWLLAKFNHFN